MAKTIAIVGTLDTKFEEMGYIRDFIEQRGHNALIVDGGILGNPPFQPQMTRQEIAKAAGTTLEAIIAFGDEGKAIAKMTEGASKIVLDLYSRRKVDAVVSVGGSMGTSLCLAVMKALPVGLPKLMVSTIAFSPLVSGADVASDQWMAQAPVDLWGLNAINKSILRSAAAAIVGMAEVYEEIIPEKPMIGVTTRGILRYLDWIKPMLEERGYEVVVSPSSGMVGGGSFEKLISQGLFTAVMDLCTGEILEGTSGGSLSAGPDRLETAGKMGLPQIVSTGCMEYWHWPGPAETIPEWRKRHLHNPLVLCVKATTEEMIVAAKLMAEKLNRARGPVTVLFPRVGFDTFDKPGSIFHDPEGHQALLETLKKNLHPGITMIELDVHIDDKAFAEKVVSVFDEMIKKLPRG
jgi:uncharacterized protein (UPF0261 family)